MNHLAIQKYRVVLDQFEQLIQVCPSKKGLYLEGLRESLRQWEGLLSLQSLKIACGVTSSKLQTRSKHPFSLS